MRPPRSIERHRSRFERTTEETMRRLLVTGLVAAAASCVAFAAMAQTINLRLAHGSPRGHPNYAHAEMLAQDIEKATNGRVKITVFGDRQLGDDRDIIQIVRTGTVDAGYASSVPVRTIWMMSRSSPS